MQRSAPTTRGLGAARVVAGDIKLTHSVFAMPFALLAAFMAATGGGAIEWPRLGGQVALVVLAMIFARTVAMLSNRLLDREIDARNPRTAGRALPSGRLPVRTAIGVLLGSAAAFAVVCAAFGLLYRNWWPAALSVPVLGWISVYPLFKRFTVLCHLWLGASLALSPLAAALAVEPMALATQVSLWLLAAMVLLWVSGFDVIYALQDVEIDRVEGVHSIPGRFGVRGARWVSRAAHVGAAALLVAVAVADPRFGALFGAGVVITCGLLVYEHATVARWGTTRIAMAFFTLNGVISCVLGALGIADVFV